MTAANDEHIHKDPFNGRAKVCKHHFERMASTVQAHGLWPRVSRTREELVARNARHDPYDVDPLELLHNMVFGKSRHMAALNQAQLKPGELEGRCPVCFFDVGAWIEEAGQAVALRLRKLDEEKLADQVRNEELSRDAGRRHSIMVPVAKLPSP